MPSTPSPANLSTRTLVRIALLTAIALSLFVVEAQLPPLVPLPGVKLGLANIITLIALFWLGRPQALTVLLRIFLGAIYTGSFLTLAYSFAGGLLSFAFLALFLPTFSPRALWIPSILSSMAHQTGQILCAIGLTGTPEILAYLPPLLLVGSVTGLFTGLVAQALFNHPAFPTSPT